MRCLAQVMSLIATLTLSFGISEAVAFGTCSRFPAAKSTAHSSSSGSIDLPWRTDYPATAPSQTHAWEAVPFTDWENYITAVLSEVKASGLSISSGSINMPQTAEWWIAPWMDYGANGREPLIGLTKERGPNAGDLSPTSPAGHEVWAIGWYNAEGAFGLKQIFADPCNPIVPAPIGGVPWTFPNGTASFKLLFTTADATAIPYLDGAPTVHAKIGQSSFADANGEADLRLLQVDVGIRDPDATGTEWVMGTFIWKGPTTGDGFWDNLLPVGLMWGNDPGVQNNTFDQFAAVQQTRLNTNLAGVVWQGATPWPQRPFPGFQGRLNGPADNLRSSCLSCHALAQWRRDGHLSIVPNYQLSPPPNTAKITDLVAKYFKNVKGGTLNDPSSNATPLDYSLQLEAAFTRICQACRSADLTGPTPAVCKVPSNGRPGNDPITRDTCEMTTLQNITVWLNSWIETADPETPPRQ